MSMVDPLILQTDAYEIIKKDFNNSITQGPDFECTICFKLEYKRTVKTLDPARYDDEIFNKCCQTPEEKSMDL